MKPETYLARARDRLAARRSRTRAVFVGGPFMLVGMFAGAFGGAQETPRGLTEDLLQEALTSELEVPEGAAIDTESAGATARDVERESASPAEAQRSVIPVLIWLVGIGAAAITIPRLRYGTLGWAEPDERPRAAGMAGVASPTAAVLDQTPSGRTDPGAGRDPGGSVVDLDEYRASRRASGEPAQTAVESLRLPPHVVEMLARNAERVRQANRAPSVRLAEADGTGNADAPAPADRDSGGFDIVVPRYDPRGGS